MIDANTIMEIVLSLIILWLGGKHYYIRKTIKLSNKQKQLVQKIIIDLQDAISDNKLTPEEITTILNNIYSLIGVKEDNTIEMLTKIIYSIINKGGD